MTLPSISVLMPVYNAEHYVAEVVENILAQTFSDFEFIIVNDGYTDAAAPRGSPYSGSRVYSLSYAM